MLLYKQYIAAFCQDSCLLLYTGSEPTATVCDMQTIDEYLVQPHLKQTKLSHYGEKKSTIEKKEY